MSKHPKADLYLAEREKGLTYREIAEKYGVSYQSVHATCCSVEGAYQMIIIERGCIYPNLRKWLNEDKNRKKRFFEQVKCCGIRDVLKGEKQPRKGTIDAMLRITGMTYEEMFMEDDHERKE